MALTGHGPGEIVVRYSRPRMMVGAAGSALFVATIPFILSVGPEEGASGIAICIGVALVTLLFFGTGLLLTVDVLLHDTPAMVIGAEGIAIPSPIFGTCLIAWHDLAGTSRTYNHFEPVVCLKFRDPDGFIMRQPRRRRIMLKVHQRLNGSPVTVPMGGLSISASDLQGMVERHMYIW